LKIHALVCKPIVRLSRPGEDEWLICYGEPACTCIKAFAHAGEKEAALLIEFVLHGLASYSLIPKKIVELGIEFKDPTDGMLNIQFSSSCDNSDEEDYRQTHCLTNGEGHK
jgi:hypothetical protein